jgi:thioredoxin 1
MSRKLVIVLAAIMTVFMIYGMANPNPGNTGKVKIEKLTAKTFKEKVFDYEKSSEWKYKGQLPAIIDFYADWCGPCKMIAPILDQLSKDYEGKIVIYKVDVDVERELASVFQTQSIPSILFIPKTGQPQMAKGALPKETFEKAILEVLKVKK